MVTKTQVHAAGTAVVIDRENRTIGKIFPGSSQVRDIVSLDADWMQRYLHCRVCGSELDDRKVARAFWNHEPQACCIECLRAETLKRYACCDQAKPRGCVCTYSTTCPVHGDRCFGTHD